MDPKNVTPFLIGALVIFAMYRRVRRNFGPQPVRVGALTVRAVLLLVVGAACLYFSARQPRLLMALAGGIAAGVLLATVGLRHTQFRTTDKGRFYTPHTYIGLFVTSLFLFRVIARYISINANPIAAAGAHQGPLVAYQNPLTLSVLGVLVGYYGYFNIGVLRKSRDEAPSTASMIPPDQT